MKDIFKKSLKLSVVYSFGNLLQRVLSILLLPLYVSYFTVGEYGILSLMVISSQFLASIVYEPFTTALKRFFYKPEYLSDRKKLIFNLLFAMFLKAFFVSFIYYLAGDLICKILIGDSRYVSFVRAFSLIVFFAPFVSFSFSFLQMSERAKFYVVISLMNFIMSFTSIIVFIVWLKAGLFSVPVGMALGYVLVIVSVLPALFKEIEIKASFSLLKKALSYSYPLLPFTLSDFVMQYSDRYIIRIFLGVDWVGIYSFGYNLAKIVNILLVMPVMGGFVPAINRLEKNPDRQKKFISETSIYVYAAGVCVVLLFSLFSKEIVLLLSRKPDYLKAVWIMPIVAFSYAQLLLGIFLGFGMSMRMKSFHISGIMIFSAFINVLLNIIFVPLMGIIGAAVATLISFAVWNILKMYYSLKFYGLRFDVKRILEISFGFLIMFVLGAVFDNYFKGLFLVFLKLAIVFAYVLIFKEIFMEMKKSFF